MVKERNIAYIYQPHFKTSMFRPAVRDQQQEGDNFIVVTCSRDFNGVWKYDGSLRGTFETKKNGNLDCYQVPISVCSRVKRLEEITNPQIVETVKRMQEKWVSNDVRGRDYTYSSKPEWMLK